MRMAPRECFPGQGQLVTAASGLQTGHPLTAGSPRGGWRKFQGAPKGGSFLRQLPVETGVEPEEDGGWGGGGLLRAGH